MGLVLNTTVPAFYFRSNHAIGNPSPQQTLPSIQNLNRRQRDIGWLPGRAELALEHVEEKTHITLSRQIGTPNIASKGKLEPRTVLMPGALVDPDSASKTPAASRSEPLVQELLGSVPLVSTIEGNDTVREGPANDIRDKTNASANTKPKSILKAAPAASLVTETSASAGVRKPLIEEVTNGVQVAALGPNNSLDEKAASALPPLRWKWAKDGERLRIEVDVPGLVRFFLLN